ncbi:ABC transporter permease [Luedemannella helvata]|uniref:ABC transporter permease n=1 Tax=Luedemannella helvata TaxID=349315 RepID=A0ABN2JXJ7_9ACTN
MTTSTSTERPGAAAVTATAAVPGHPGAPGGARSGAAAARRLRGTGGRWRRAVTPLAILAGWEAASRAGVLPPTKLTAPSQVLETGWRLAADGSLGQHVLESLTRAGIGLGIGAALGLALGALAGLSRLGDDLIDPPLQMARMLPHLALVPLLIIWIGIGESVKVTLVALGAFFPIYLNTYAGIRDIDQRLVEAARSCGLSALDRLRHVVLPGSLPSIFIGLRLAFGAGWLSLVVGEQVNAERGIGFMIMEARDFSQTDIVVLGLVIYALLGLASDLILRSVERRALAWRRGLTAT